MISSLWCRLKRHSDVVKVALMAVELAVEMHTCMRERETCSDCGELWQRSEVRSDKWRRVDQTWPTCLLRRPLSPTRAMSYSRSMQLAADVEKREKTVERYHADRLVTMIPVLLLQQPQRRCGNDGCIRELPSSCCVVTPAQQLIVLQRYRISRAVVRARHFIPAISASPYSNSTSVCIKTTVSV